jgi:large subunit ribosomal protein L18
MSTRRRSTTSRAACSRRRATRGQLKTRSAASRRRRARAIGKAIGEKLLALKVTPVVFDRNGFIYHGRVKEVADGAREAGLQF